MTVKTYPYNKEDELILQGFCNSANSEPMAIDFQNGKSFIVISKDQYYKFFLKVQELKELFSGNEEMEEMEKFFSIRKAVENSKQQFKEGRAVKMTKKSWDTRRKALEEKYILAQK